MKAEHLEVLVEDPSMEKCLRELLPKLLGDAATFGIYPSQCKEEFLDQLPKRLKGYKSWIPDKWKVVVIVDCDDDACRQLKEKLENISAEAGLRSRTKVGAGKWQIVNRIAIEELEAWFFGDMNAVRKAYSRVSKNIEKKAAYRNPDAIRGGTWENLERILRNAGYFKGGLGKIEAARQIGKNLDPKCNISRSFQVFRDALLEAIS